MIFAIVCMTTSNTCRSRITITRKAGSFTWEESMAKLVLAGTIDRGDAMLRAAHPEELESLLRGA